MQTLTAFSPPQLDQPCAFPEAALIASRQELTDFPLDVLEGQLPSDLGGHYIAMGPVGDITMDAQPGAFIHPASTGVSLFNGDAMLHRFDFGTSSDPAKLGGANPPGMAHLTTRLIKPPCYYADAATTIGSPYAGLRFVSSGLGRFSQVLGFRDEVNTACIPFKFADDDRWRLMVSWDAGRPYEIDPVSLQPITPIGWNHEWREQSTPLKMGPFKLFATATHHAIDDHSQEFFTVNWGKSIPTILTPVILNALASLSHKLPLLAGIVRVLFLLIAGLVRFWNRCRSLWGGRSEDFVHLLRWNGGDKLDRWEVVLPNGAPLGIDQSMHQVGATRQYIVLMDTAFKLGPEQIIPNPIPGYEQASQTLRSLLNYAQFVDTKVYLVRRSDLDPSVSKVVAKVVTVPREIAHFRVDYDDSDGIILHAAHNNAWDAAEWMQHYDRWVGETEEQHRQSDRIDQLVGMTVCTADLNSFGRYRIDPETGNVREAKLASDPDTTWAPALYADNGTLTIPEHYGSIYWNSWGCWGELMTQFIFDLYKTHKYRQLPIEQVNQIAQRGIPANLCRLDTTTMEICDRYCFPRGYFGNSPQFMPRVTRDASEHQLAQPDSTDGYLACVVLFDDNQGQPQSQIWIFDAQNLAQGPVCKLGDRSGQMQIGLTIHTTWVPAIAPRTATYNIPIREDFEPLLVNQEAIVRKLFDEVIFPAFES